MKNFNHIKLAVLVCFALIAHSCEDVLNTSPKGVLAEGQLTSSTSVDKLVTAAYSGLAAHFFGNAEAFAGPTNNWVIDVRSDDAYKGGGGVADRTDIFQLETQTMDPTNYAVFQKWRNNLFAIARCNFAIREINNINDQTYPKNIRLGEMYLLRAHFHFDLKRNFNQIPYLTEDVDPNTASNTQYTSEELWGLIEADLLEAFSLLPISQDDIGRVNKYTAAAYLCKLYIQSGQWAKAIPQADYVMGGPFSLWNDFEEIFTLDQESGPEAVFTVQYSTANLFANHDWSSLLNSTASAGIDAGGYANGDDFYHGSQNLVNAFRTDANGLPLFDTFNDTDVSDGTYSGNLDPRVDFTVGRIGIPWKGGTAIYTDSWVRSTDYYPGYSSKKAVVSPNEPTIHNSWPWAAAGLNYHMIRYSEVLLWKAEALIESGGDLNEARNLINQVRERAKNSTYVQEIGGTGDAANYVIEPYPSSGWTQDYARQALRFERRLELAMEGARFYDLLRWGTVEQVIDTYYAGENDNVFYLDGADFVSGKHEYLPIPQNEIDLAPDLYSQNPGY